MRLLVDCVPLAVGGGIQVAIALLDNLRRQQDVTWKAVVPTRLLPALPADLAADSRLQFVRNSIQADRLWLQSRLLSLERDFAPDVVFTVFGPAYFRARAPHVVGFALPNLIYKPDPDFASGSRFVLAVMDWLRCAAIRQADHLLVETETVRQRLAERLGISCDRMTVVGNSVNPLLMDQPVAPLPGGDRFGLLVPSAYYRHKNLEIIPAVAAKIARQAPDRDFEFRLTLAPKCGPWQAIKARAEELGVGRHVTTLGHVPITELGGAYGAASAVFLPTLREASTAVYPESFHFERPLVTSDMDFARELCGEAALFVQPRDPEDIGVKIIELMSNQTIYTRLIAAGRHQLRSAYPDPHKKFAMQMKVLKEASAVSVGAGH